MQYPKPPARKTRPRFQINDAVQERTGSHSLSSDPSDTTKIPAPVNRFLRQYQREGAEFLYGQYKEGLGGILGDDMVRQLLFSFVASTAGAASLTVKLRRVSARRFKRSLSSPPSWVRSNPLLFPQGRTPS